MDPITLTAEQEAEAQRLNWSSSFPRSRVGTQYTALRCKIGERAKANFRDAERPDVRSHAERGNEIAS